MPSFFDWAVVALCIIFYVVHRQNARNPVDALKCPPSEEGHWLWGHEFKIWEKQAGEMYLNWAKALGPVYRIKAAFFQPDVIVAGDPASSGHVLQHAYKYEKAPGFLPITIKLLGRGVVWAHGDEHRRQRRLIAPAFTVNAVKGMESDVIECSAKLVGGMKKKLLAAGGDEMTVNIEPLVATCTLDIVGRTAFGHDFGSGESSDAKAISDAWHKDVLLGRTMPGFLAPILIGTYPWINKLPIPALAEDGVTKKIALKLAADILKENRAQQAVDGANNGRDILSILVKDMMKKKGTSEETMEDWQLLENISTFIMVGHETTSCSVIFTLYELARHPEIQNKLREELQAAANFEADTISALPYLDVVVKEGLRLHPASPRTDRIAIEDDVIPLSKPVIGPSGEKIMSIPVKKGQVVHIPTDVLNALPSVWGPDAHEFKPERFLNPELLPAPEELARGPYANLATFIDGPRTCIGWRLAILELKVIIAHLVRDLVFESTLTTTEKYISGTVQAFTDGKAANMPLKVRAA